MKKKHARWGANSVNGGQGPSSNEIEQKRTEQANVKKTVWLVKRAPLHAGGRKKVSVKKKADTHQHSTKDGESTGIV